VERRVVTYGIRKDSDFLVSECTVDGSASRFGVTYRNKSLGEFEIHVPGQHNVLNATAAIAVGVGLDIAPDAIRQALKDFRGVDRRFQLKGSANGVDVIDDYGHHPTEIRATLAAARQCGYSRVHVVFQPHRYTRTHALAPEFHLAFKDADTLIVTDIYSAGESPIPGVDGRSLAEGISGSGHGSVHCEPDMLKIPAILERIARPGDLVLTLGAGSIWKVGAAFLAAAVETKPTAPADDAAKKNAAVAARVPRAKPASGKTGKGGMTVKSGKNRKTGKTRTTRSPRPRTRR
jgi:UDP-N-acetylmuramate--alanine ligase